MNDLKLFVPLTKVDLEQRMVYGVLAEEAVDKSGEVFDYVTSKPLFQEWSGDFEKRTRALGVEVSKGNVRGMHTEIAAGRFADMVFNDDARNIEVAAKVVDDGEWRKVKEGVYTGFSIGGKYVKRWPDAALKATRYTAQPAEGSLVDNPCMYGATFTAVKADGATELRKFVGGTPVGDVEEAALQVIDAIAKIAQQRKDTTPGEGESKYGDVTFADPTNKKYPIDTVGHIRATWNYINKPKNAGKYSAKDAAAIKRRIVSAWKKKIDASGPPSAAEKAAAATLVKGLWHVSDLAGVLSSLDSLLSCRIWEEDAENDDAGKALNGRIAAAIGELGSILLAMTSEEVGELHPDYVDADESTEDLAMGFTAEDLKKAVGEAVAPLKDQLDKGLSPEALTKAVQDGVAKTVTETVAKAVEPLAKATDVTALTERVAKLEDVPAPVGRQVAKTLNGAGKDPGSDKTVDMIEQQIAKAKADGATPEQLVEMRKSIVSEMLKATH